jgi:ubiquinone/menaquinone biosynthesis C-methylase UbiE
MSTEKKSHDVCSAKLAGFLDLGIRRWLQNPDKILEPFIKPSQTVVDLGCGPGFFTLAMSKLVGESGMVIAVDLQEAMLQKMTAKMKKQGLMHRVVAHQCSETKLGVTKPCDFVLAFYMIHEVPDAAALLKEVYGMLSPGGSLLIVEPKIHVSLADFESAVKNAEAEGFKLESQPKVTGSRSALLRKS